MTRRNPTFCLTTAIMAAILLLVAPCFPGGVLAIQEAQPGAFCVPDGWQSGRSFTRGVTKAGSNKPSITWSVGDVIYSSSQQKLWIDDFMLSRNGGHEPTTRLYDYPGKILYTVHGQDGEKNQTCTKTPLLSPFQPLCVPVNATMTHIKSYYGVTSQTFPNTQFFMEFAGRLTHCGNIKACDVSYRVSLAREHQTPLFQQVWGKMDGGSYFQTSEFYNSTIWGTMPSTIFTPPRVCDNVTVTPRLPGATDEMTDTMQGALLLL